MADKLLPALGVEVSARGVAEHYGSRRSGGLLDGWLMDEADTADLSTVSALGLATSAVPLYLTDRAASAAVAAETLALAERVSG
jgi:LPPG:FO 2-phospho-L-lactate transferase